MTLVAAFDLRPDELLYSAIARYAHAMAYPRQRAVLAAAFGRPSGVAGVDFPGHLDALVAGLPPGHGWTSAALLWRHTLLPYYAWCIPPERARQVAETLYVADGRTVHERLGTRASAVPTPRYLRYCPACAAADRTAYGSAHWRRVHQPPGVYVCPTHDAPLRVSAARRMQVVSRLMYHTLEATSGPDDALALAPVTLAACTPETRELLAWLAHETAWLLAHAVPSACPTTRVVETGDDAPIDGGPPAAAPGLARLWARCRRYLTEAGFVQPSGRVRLADLRATFLAHYDERLLATLGCALRTSAAGDDWLARLVRRPRVAQHPLHHLLVLRLLGVSAAETCAERTLGGDGIPFIDNVAPAIDAAKRSTVALPPAPRPRAHSGTSSSDWDRRLRALVRDHSVSLREIGRRLGITPKTVQRHAQRLGVWRTAWRTWARSRPGTARRASTAATLRRHRAVWQRLRRAHPGWSTAEIQRARPATYSYLYRYDRAWLDAHRPAPGGGGPPPPRVDWPARDAALRRKAEQIVAAMHASDSRPQRITFAAVARRMGCGQLLPSCREQLPGTMAYLTHAVESPVAYAARRVWWVAAECAARAAVPPTWAFVRAAGLRPSLAHVLRGLIARTLVVLRLVVAETDVPRAAARECASRHAAARGSHLAVGAEGRTTGIEPVGLTVLHDADVRSGGARPLLTG